MINFWAIYINFILDLWTFWKGALEEVINFIFYERLLFFAHFELSLVCYFPAIFSMRIYFRVAIFFDWE